MDGTCLALSVAQTLFAALQCSELKGLFSMWGYKSELQNLESTVKTIKAVLLSADSKHALTPQEWDFIDNLKDVVYEADDLIDEFVTLVALQQQHQSPGKVRSLFKRFEKLSFAYKTSQKVKSIRKKMDRVADDASKFCFKIDDLPIRNRREETCSYVNVNDIVGRDDDREKIVHMLLDPNLSQEDVSVVTIVGVGGLGKTALAQLVYNDPRTVEEFPLRMWVCVSDQDQNQFDVKPILVNILNSTSTSLEQVVQELRKKLVEKKYLLVLDDVWTENHGDWIKLKSCLLGLNQRGNKIVVTTRSEGTAVAVESSHTYKLQGLSDESSWCLFEMVVGYKRANSPDLVEIGRDIVKKCVNVPLALKVVGSLLYGQERNTWVSFQKSRLSEVRKTENDIMSILEFSYRNLSSSLRSCFIYCALFPKDFELDKGELLELWMAQGYVEPLDEGQNIEDAAQECFQILARRCFFQDLKMYENEDVTFKIHDLMHDLAQQVAGKEISIAYSTTSTLNKGIRHLYDDSPRSRTRGFMVEAKIRTFLAASGGYNVQFPISTLPENWRSLRTLELRSMGLSSLPDTIGQLLHLRYLNLSDNEQLTMLPKSLTKLINLQFLNLKACYELKELPVDLSKLVNLRTLYVEGVGLEYMPLGLGKMTRLTRLNWFMVGEKKSSLEELKSLSNLKGHTGIRICRNYKHAKEYCGKGEYICHIENLNSIFIEWAYERTNEEVRLGNDEEILEDLQPHTNLKELSIERYQGVRIPGWAREGSLTTSLPNLVKIRLEFCDGLEELPWLGRLQHLKTLELSCLKKVEYMENRRSIGCSSNDEAEASNSSTPLVSSRILFFPSLETLQLYSLNNLKGWWMGEDEMLNTAALPSFPCLSYLEIFYCENLTSFPLCPCVETLRLFGLNERFEGIMIKREEGEEMGVGGSSSSSSRSCDSGIIKPISADKLLYLKYLEIGDGAEVKSMSEWEELFRSCSPTLCSLKLYDVPRLPKGMRYLTSLQSLELHLPLMKEIPEWIECLSSLQSLTLEDCCSMASLPIEMKNLTSLKRFELRDCGDYFQRRCKSPDGEYWPMLQHIPTITIK